MAGTAKKAAVAGGIVAGALVLGLAFNGAASVIYPVESGAEYLRGKGYTDVSGGGMSFFNTCGEDVYARKFDVTNKSGKRTTATVCYGLWKYESLI